MEAHADALLEGIELFTLMGSEMLLVRRGS